VLSHYGLEQDSVDEAKNDGVRPDAESKSQHGHGGEAGILGELADGEFEIAHGVIRFQIAIFARLGKGTLARLERSQARYGLECPHDDRLACPKRRSQI